MSELLRCAASSNNCPEPIGLDKTINEALSITSSHIQESSNSSGTYRKPPLLISRMARGGKTTVLLAIFDRIKATGNNAMFITFNGSSNFKRLYEESEEEAFYRVIAAQLVDLNGYRGKIVPDWEFLDHHIGESPFVLLVDEINALSFPVSGKLSIILKNYFLDKANRFLVFSSHLPVDLEGDFNRESAGSVRPCEVLSLPICMNMKLLREMGSKCAYITKSTVAYYGGIPSLIYCEYQNRDYSPVQRFLSFNSLTITAKNSFLADFVDELLEGKMRQTHVDVRCFDKLASLRTVVLGPQHQKEQRIHWPLCYIACVLELVGSNPIVASEIVSLITKIRFYQDDLNVGGWWEEVVKIAFLLRFVHSANSGSAGPFGLCGANEAQGAVISAVRFLPATKSVDEARREMHSTLGKLNDGCHLVLFYPSNPSLEQFDGYVAFKRVARNRRSSNVQSIIIGYQCKAGCANSEGEKPSWLHKAILLRGNAMMNASYPRQWYHASKEEVTAFLGFSLAMLCDLYNEAT